MEKSKSTAKRQFNNRLLAFLFIFFTVPLSLFSEVLTSRQIRNLKIQPDSNTVFTQKDCIFTLSLPGIKPEYVKTTLPKLPVGVQFISSRRSDFIDSDRDVGTQIEYWFSFSTPGTFTIPPLSAVINERNYSIAFSSVSVYENPANIIPKMIIKFTGGMKGSDQSSDAVFNENNEDPSTKGFYCAVGTKVYLTVYLKYVVQIVKFDWQLQKNSLFSELEEYEIIKGQPRGTNFSNEEIPVARFEWVPLSAGNWVLPDIKITATAYNGSRIDVSTPSIAITVSEAAEKKTVQSKTNDAVFAYAFTESKVMDEDDKTISLTKAQCSRLAQLRSAEQNSFLFSKERKVRSAYEKELGILTDISEPSDALFYFCLIAGFIFFALSVLFLIRKHKFSILFFILGFVLLVFAIIQGASIKDEYGIFTGGVLSPIPEETSSASRTEAAGSRVEVLEKTDNWVYIVYNGTGGWVSADCIFIIK